jgi:hypothetical protein
MIAPHKCFFTTYLLIAPFVEWIVNLREIKQILFRLQDIDCILLGYCQSLWRNAYKFICALKMETEY